jgi:hypothetical protein
MQYKREPKNLVVALAMRALPQNQLKTESSTREERHTDATTRKIARSIRLITSLFDFFPPLNQLYVT